MDEAQASRVKTAAPNFPKSTFASLDPRTLGLPGTSTVRVQVIQYDPTESEYRCNGTVLRLKIPDSECAPDTCDADLHDWLLDAAVSKGIVRDEADLLLVHPSSSGGVWICSLQGEAGAWTCTALHRETRPVVDTTYALTGNSDQAENLANCHHYFLQLVDKILIKSQSNASQVLLRAKVHPRERWFLRFPLGIFAKMRYSGFERYSACQWIVTTRTISAVAANQTAVERQMTDTSSFLLGAHIVLNTYTAHNSATDAASINEGFELVLQLLDLFQDLPIRGKILGLKWTLNPSVEQLVTLMTSPATQFLFADFEAAGGIWTMGDGPHRCSGHCDYSIPHQLPDQFDVGRLKGRLEHVWLLRVFHCNSLYDPYNFASQPIDDGTIASALLDTGAFFVEGSITAEPLLDFVCTLLSLLIGRQDLRTILLAKSLSGACNIPNLIARANVLLAQRGFSTIH